MASSVERLLAEQQQGVAAGGPAPADTSEVDRLLERTRANTPPTAPTPAGLGLAELYAGHDPDRAARIIKAQRSTGLAADVIHRNLDDIEAKQRAQPLSTDELTRLAPATAGWLSEDPLHLGVARPDVSKMSYLERLFRHTAQEFGSGVATLRLTRIGMAAMMGTATDEHRLEQAQIERELGEHVDYGIGQGFRPVFQRYGPDGDAMYEAMKASSPFAGAVLGGAELAEQIPGAAAQQLPITAGELGTKALGAGVGAIGGSLAGPGGTAAGAAIGWKVGAIPSAAIMEASTAYLDFEKLRDDQGRPLDRKMILGAAIVTGAVNGSLEALSLEQLAHTIPGIRSLGRQGMRELLAKQTTRQALEHVLKEIGESAATEGTTEFLQQYVSNLSGRLVQLHQNEKKLSVGEFLEQTIGDRAFFEDALEAGKGGLLAAIGTGGAGGAFSVAQKAIQVRRAERVANVFRAIGQGAQDNELLKRLPDAHQELVSRMTKNGPLETTYVPVERFTEYFQEKELDPGQVARELGVGDAYDEAQRTGGLLAIPTSTYATKLAGTEHHNALLQDLTFSPDELSLREAKVQAKQLEEEHTAAQALEDPRRRAADAVTEHITTQLRAAGFNERTASTYASALYGAPMRALAERLGGDVDAKQLLDRFKLSITNPDLPGAPPVVDVAQLRKIHEATRTAALERVGKVLEDGEERFAGPRTPGGARRPIERVSTRGLLTELLDLEEKRVDAEGRSLYRLDRDENFHAGGVPVFSSKFKAGDKVTMQAKALQNLADYRRITDQVFGELQKRGLDQAAAFDAMEDLRTELDERAAIAGGWDPRQKLADVVTDEHGNVLFQPAPPVDSPAFKQWFGDSKVVDEDGNPLVVFHGTTRNFDVFDRSKANIESDQGAGFYFTNTEEDVEANYGHHEGPDLKNKIEHRAESIENEIGDQLSAYQDALDAHDEGLASLILETHPELERLGQLEPVDERGNSWGSPRREAIRELAKQRATAELTEHAGAVMPVYLSLQNPVVIGGDDETHLTFSEDFDPETDEYTNQGGTLLDFLDELDRVAGNFHDVDARELGSLREQLLMATVDNGGELGIREIQDMVNTALQYATDDTGQLANHEIVRQTLEGMGFDGIIDHAVNDKFGDARSSGQAMEGMHGGTTHYVAFRPEQIKSAIANRGTFDPNSPNILEQRAYHGSPHQFDRFSIEHIGSGEGAQVYGWGLYFAGKKEVAQWYREKLTQQPAPSDLYALPSGETLGEFLDRAFAALPDEQPAAAPGAAFNPPLRPPSLSLAKAKAAVASVAHDLMKMPLAARAHLDFGQIAIAELSQRHFDDTRQWQQQITDLEPIVDNRTVYGTPDGPPATIQQLERAERELREAVRKVERANAVYDPARKILEQLRTELGVGTAQITPVEAKAAGRLFTVELEPEDHEWLDWDKPLVEQSEYVRNALEARQLGKEIVVKINGKAPAEVLRDLGLHQQGGFGAWNAALITELEAGRPLDETVDYIERTYTEIPRFFLDRPGRAEHWQATKAKWLETIRGAQLNVQAIEQLSPDMTGSDLYHDVERMQGSAQRASELLHRLGIPGIRYLDGTSRSKGEGTHNFVVFDDKLVAIREYEQAVEEAPPADPSRTLYLDRLIGEHDLGLLVKLAPLLRGNEIARGGTTRQLFDELTQLVLMGGFDEQLKDDDPIASPAVRVGEALYRGKTHGEAIAAAMRLGTRRDRIEEGWMTRGNAFLTRDEAAARAQVRMDPIEGAVRVLHELGIDEVRLTPELRVTSMREYEQRAPAPRRRDLIVQHNITAANLLHAEDVGGLAMPSVAITHGDKAITGFGEITLLGDQVLVDPRRAGNKLRVFGADAYSPRYPDVEHKLSPKALARLAAELEPYRQRTDDENLRWSLKELEKRGPRELERSPAVIASFIESLGMEIPSTDTYRGEPTSSLSDRRLVLEAYVRQHQLEAQLQAYARELFDRLEPQGRIRVGWTAAGNPRYIAHTLENVIKIMRKQLRGGETETNIYGVGQIRAEYTPEFRTITQIREAAAEGRLITNEQMEQLKDEIDSEFFELANELAPFAPDRSSEEFRWPDTVAGFLTDAARRGIDYAAREWAMPELAKNPIARTAIHTFQGKLRHMPTEYFEGKYLRAVDPREFKAAVIPAGAPLRVRELLREKGLQIAEYKMGDEADRKRVIEETARQHDLLFQGPSDPRGRIRIGDHEIKIELLEKANLSTFIHETGHFYLEVMGTLAGDENAPAQIREDYATILKYLGAEDRPDITREQHERFARSFEAYLLEGNAPSPELRTPFARFRTWLVSLYRSVRGLRVQLTPEVRQVFDRLFATDEEIAAAEQPLQALFADPSAVGMTENQAAEYSRAVGDAKQAARDELATKAMAELTRERKAWWKEERERTRELVAQQVYAEPLSIALSVLQKGTMPDGSPLPAELSAVKLDRELLVDTYGKELVRALPRGLYSKEGGLSADDAAALFGFKSGTELLTALGSSEKIPARVDRLTDERMRQEHGNMLEDGTLADQAQAAVHNVDRGRVLRLELEHLVSSDLAAAKGMLRKLGRRIPSTELSRRLAEETIQAKRIRDIRPIEYQKAEQKASQLAIDHFTKGDIQAAFEEKLRELHNFELYRAAAAAKEESDKIVELMRSFDRPAVRARIGKAGGDYLEQIDGIRERYSFTRLTERQLRNRESLVRFTAKLEKEGEPIDVPPAVLNEARRQHWTDTSLEELQGVRDAVEQIAHLARAKNKLLASERARNLEDARAELRAGAAEYFNLERDPVDITRPIAEKLKSGASKALAAHTRMEFLFQHLDGFKANGPFWTYFFKPMAAAEDLENTMRRHDAQQLEQLLGAYTKDEREDWFLKRFDIPGTATDRIQGTFTKANVLAIALNWGNEYNRAALMEGYGWTEAHVEKILATLDARDAKFVQGIWDHLDSYWPAASELERDVTGLAPAKVEASPLTIAGVQLEGGYYPIAFDREQSSRTAQLDLAAAVQDMTKGYSARAMTRHGHLKERTSTGGKPLQLELSVISKHLNQVTHDLAFRKAIIDVQKLIRDPEIQDTIERAVGRDMYQQLGPWVGSIAGDTPRENLAMLERIASRARSGITAVGLGFNLASSLVQTLGYFNATAELGPVYAARGLRDFYSRPWAMRETWQFIVDRSPSMRDRLGGFDREVRDVARRPGETGILGVDPGALYTLIGYMDLGVSIPSWLGAYRKAMDGNQEGITAGDERAAIDYADSVVRTTQAAGGAKDLAAVQRGTQWYKLYTAFYSSMSVLFNQFARIPQQYAIDKNAGRMIGAIVLTWFLPAVLEDMLRGRGPDPDEDKLKWAAKKVALYPLSTVVLVRDFANAIDRSLETGRVSLGQNAIGTIIESLAKTSTALVKELEGHESTRADYREAFNTLGYVTELPSRQMWKTGEFFHDWWTGDSEPHSLLDFLSGVVHGKPKD